MGEVPAVDLLTTVLEAGTPLGPMFCQLAALPLGSVLTALAAFAAPLRWASAIKLLG